MIGRVGRTGQARLRLARAGFAVSSGRRSAVASSASSPARLRRPLAGPGAVAAAPSPLRGPGFAIGERAGRLDRGGLRGAPAARPPSPPWRRLGLRRRGGRRGLGRRGRPRVGAVAAVASSVPRLARGVAAASAVGRAARTSSARARRRGPGSGAARGVRLGVARPGSRWPRTSNSRIEPGDGGVQRADRAAHRDAHEQVAPAPDRRAQAVALAADDDRDRARGGPPRGP